MKRFGKWVGLCLLAGLLGACNSFIPDQSIANAYGLDGQEVTLTQSINSLTTQQFVSFYEGSFSASFTDFDASDVPGFVNPNTLRELLGIEPSFSVSSTSAAGAFPAEVTVTASKLDLSLSDASGPIISKAFGSDDGLSITFTKDACEAGVLMTCTYTTDLVSVVLLTLMLGGQDLDDFYERILTDGDSPNSVSGTFGLTLSTGLPADSSITVILATEEGTLTF